MTHYQDLIDKVRRCRKADNALDIAIDIALFQPDALFAAVRANNAGTKLIYTEHNGAHQTCWAQDHTLTSATRKQAISDLLILQSNEATNVED